MKELGCNVKIAYFILWATVREGINPLWVAIPFYLGRNTLSVNY